jgi:hypothetical protein
MSSSASTFLRRVLAVDGAVSGATGILMVVAAGFLAQYLGLPAALLRYAGVSLIPFALFVGWLATRAQLSRATVGAVIAANAAWVVASAGLLLSGAFDPTTLGYAFVIGQAVAVAGLAEMQYAGLARG